MAWLGDGSGQGAIVTQKDGKSVRPARASSQFTSSARETSLYFFPRELAASIDAVIDQGARVIESSPILHCLRKSAVRIPVQVPGQAWERSATWAT